MERISIYRHGRGAPISWEWHTHQGTYYLMAGISDPRAHRWWATSVYVYLPDWIGRTPLARIPSTGWRSLGDKWAPLRPWAGKSRPWSRKGKRS